jgi:hypothetical protein
MIDFNDLWVDLFGYEISEFELKVMKALESRVGSNDTTLMLCAIMMFCTFFPLFRDPKSPFLIARNLGEAAKNLDSELKQLRNDVRIQSDSAWSLSQSLNGLKDTIANTKAVLASARRDAREREDFPLNAYFYMSFICFSSSILGVFLTLMLLKSGIVV